MENNWHIVKSDTLNTNPTQRNVLSLLLHYYIDLMNNLSTSAIMVAKEIIKRHPTSTSCGKIASRVKLLYAKYKKKYKK